MGDDFKDIKLGDHRIEGTVVGVIEVDLYRYPITKMVLEAIENIIMLLTTIFVQTLN